MMVWAWHAFNWGVFWAVVAALAVFVAIRILLWALRMFFSEPDAPHSFAQWITHREP